MTGRALRWLAAAALTATIGLGASRPALAIDDAMIAAAKKEGEVTWYTGLIVNLVVKPIAAGFEKKYGIKVNVLSTDDADTLLKIVNEERAGKVVDDIFDSAGTIIPPLVQAGVLEKFQPASAANYAPEFKDKDGYWTSVVSLYLTAAYNTELVKPSDVPKTYQDLLDPKWKGKMIWTNSRASTGPAGFIANILQTMGQEAGMAYLKKLSEQKITNFTGNQRVILDQVIAGQYPLALMVYNHHTVISQGKGAPIQWIKMDPLVADLTTVGLVKNAPHPNAAKLFLEYMFSEEGQGVIRDAGYPPSHPNVHAKDPSISPNTGGFKTFLPDMAGASLDGWLKIYDDLFK